MLRCFSCGLDQQCCVDLNPAFAKAVAEIPLEPVETYFDRTEAVRLHYYEEILRDLPTEILLETQPDNWKFKLSLRFVKTMRGLL